MIDPITAVAGPGASAAATNPASTPSSSAASADGMADRFQRLMLDTPPEHTASAHQPGAVSSWTEVFRAQEAMLRSVEHDVTRFVADAPQMGIAELTARNMDLTMKAHHAQTQLTTVTSIAQSAKSGLQTLMKNQ